MDTDVSSKVDAVILAGALNEGPLGDLSTERYEALVPLAGRGMVQYVIDALRDAETVDGISLVGFPEFRERMPLEGVRLVPAGKTFLDSARIGLEVNPTAERLLFITSDVPMVTGPVIDRFVSACMGREGDFFVPVVTRTTSEARFPGVRRTYVKLREGEITLGNCFFGTRHSIGRVLPEIEKLVQQRKSPLRMAVTLGPVFVIRLLTHTAGLVHLERLFRRVTGTEGHAIMSDDAELATDVDKPEQLLTIERLLAEHHQSGGWGLP